MEKYRLVKEHKTEEDELLETSNCEIRITQQGKPRNYISYAMNMFVRSTFASLFVLGLFSIYLMVVSPSFHHLPLSSAVGRF